MLEKNRDYECAQERFLSEKVCQTIRVYELMLQMLKFFFLFFQTSLAKAKEELEDEKRELVRTLERRSSEVEHLNGMETYYSCCIC